jgi:hypothetical protein
MRCQDPYGYELSTGADAASAYNRGLLDLLRLRSGALESVAASVVMDHTFALGHASLALFGHELCANVDVPGRLRQAVAHLDGVSERERSHVLAVRAHVAGDATALTRHLAAYPRDALLLSTAVPTIAFAGVTEVPEEAWAIVERAAPSYGVEDWWFTGLLAFVRTEQLRFEEAMELSLRSLALEPGAGHAAHARAHAHYETGDHHAGLAWMDAWVLGDGAGIDSLSHFSWHAALHELSLGDTAAVRRRYDAQLRPEHGLGCRALVDSGSLLVRWALSADDSDRAVPDIADVARVTGEDVLSHPATPFLAMHAACTLLALGDAAGLDALSRWSADHAHPTHREVVAPLAAALAAMARGSYGPSADALGLLTAGVRRLGGSDAQREIVEECRSAALLRAGRLDDARLALDARLDRRESPRDRRWRARCEPAPAWAQAPAV